MTAPKILIVEDEGIVAADIQQQLRLLGYEPVRTVTSGEAAIQLVETVRPQLVLMDIHLAGAMDGIDAAAIIRERFSVPCVFLTAYATDEIVERAKIAEPLGYLIKPFDESSLRTTLEIALHRDHVDRQLRASEARYRAVVQSAREAIVTEDGAGHLVGWSPAAENMFGYTEAEAIGLSASVLLVDGEHAAYREAVRRRWADGARDTFDALEEGHGRHKDGREFPIERSLARWETSEGRFVTAFIRDISERVRSQSSLRLQGAALNAAANAMVITDRDGTIEWVNPAFTTLTGYDADEAIGHNSRDIVKSGVHDEAFYTQMWDTILHGGVWAGEVINRRKDGSHYPEHQTITPVRDAMNQITHFIGVKRDLSAEKHLQEQFLQAQKMEVVGRLAGGIAHDFNNLLTVINGESEFAIAELPEGDPSRTSFTYILDAGRRATRLTRQLLTFSRKQVTTPTILSLTAQMHELAPMIQRLIGEDIRLVLAVPERPLDDHVRIDAGQLEQVVLNLAVNARDAMPTGGTVTIQVEAVAITDTFVSAQPGVTTGPYVRLAVTDTGIGITAAVRERMFEPFFTTKSTGKGTGLGLATVYAVVQQSGGLIDVKSEPGQGASFRLYLPVTASAPDAPSQGAGTPLIGTETIVLVEDEDGLRELVARMLRATGYTVLAFPDGERALSWLAQPAQPVHLIITDVVMPGMNGTELAQAVAKTHPTLPVLFASGYVDDKLTPEAVADPMRFIAKPFTASALAAKVRHILDTRRT